jgi:hypothetical protein
MAARLLVLVLAVAQATCAQWSSAVCDAASGACALHAGRDVAGAQAEGVLEDAVQTEGWGKLWVRTAPGAPARMAARAAGFVEGALTAKLIVQHFRSWYSVTFPKDKPLTEATREFLLSNYAWALQLAASGNGLFYQRLGELLAQTEGLLEGVNYAAAEGESMSLLEVLLLQAAGDLYDIIPATNISEFRLEAGRVSAPRFKKEWHRAVSCSALVKVLEDGSDVVAGHTTWSTMENMLRVYKHYQFGLRERVSFSSKPGLLYSKDDFYVLPHSRMVVMETTNGIMDKTVYASITPLSLLTWQRIPVANALARGGEHWTELASKHSSGTYANQWIVVDGKRFESGGRGARDGMLWIVEQAGPLINVAADVTDVLRRQGGYFASYNVPFFESVYNKTGFRKAFEAYGEEYSYSKCPRAQIFAREQAEVRSLHDAERLLRFNRFDKDPLSLGDPSNSISARSDLAPNRTRAKAFGGIDSKVAALSLAATGHARAENGPSHDDQPPFRWSTSPFAKQVHLGQPDLFNFSFVDMRRLDHFPDEVSDADERDSALLRGARPASSVQDIM